MSYLYGKKKNKNKEKNVCKPVKKNNYHERIVKKTKTEILFNIFIYLSELRRKRDICPKIRNK